LISTDCDEGQEMSPLILNELRLLSSARFDSQSLLCIVLAGDGRLLEKLRREELVPLGSRIRTRLATEAATREELLACVEHLLAAAGNAFSAVMPPIIANEPSSLSSESTPTSSQISAR
jgi:general secretion pathway protein A